MPVLTIAGLVKQFGPTRVLDGIDLSVDEHEVVVLIGASGSGKSTLLRCINLLEVVDDGVITLDGEDITDPRAEVDMVRRRIGVVFQSYNLFPHMSVLDNITLAPRLVHGLSREAADQRARELLHRVGLGDRATGRRTIPTDCPGDSSSAQPSPGPLPINRACCCSTRSPAPLIPSWSERSSH